MGLLGLLGLLGLELVVGPGPGLLGEGTGG